MSEMSSMELERLWAGMEVNVSEAAGTVRTLTSRDGGGVQIMGHYNTGTNLLEALLMSNFPSEFTIAAGSVTSGPCKFWKHADLQQLKSARPDILSYCKEGAGTVGLALVRNPLSWLASFHHEAYDLWACKDGSDWLTRPCVYPLGSPACLGGKSFDNLEVLWGHWASTYRNLPEYGFKRYLLIRYEDLVLRTKQVMNTIAKVAGIPPPKELEQIDDDKSPTAQDDNGRVDSENKLKTKSYLSDLTADEMRAACERLDATQMHYFLYEDDCKDIL